MIKKNHHEEEDECGAGHRRPRNGRRRYGDPVDACGVDIIGLRNLTLGKRVTDFPCR